MRVLVKVRAREPEEEPNGRQRWQGSQGRAGQGRAGQQAWAGGQRPTARPHESPWPELNAEQAAEELFQCQPGAESRPHRPSGAAHS